MDHDPNPVSLLPLEWVEFFVRLQPSELSGRSGNYDFADDKFNIEFVDDLFAAAGYLGAAAESLHAACPLVVPGIFRVCVGYGWVAISPRDAMLRWSLQKEVCICFFVHPFIHE